MQKQSIPISLLFHANSEQQFDILRVWICLKSLKQVNIPLDYKSLSNRFNISHTTLRRHVIKICEIGLGEIRNKHLHLTGINKLKKHENEKCVLIPVEPTKKKQILQFRKAILQRNIDNQKEQIKIKSNIVTHCNRPHAKISKSEMKVIKKAGGVSKLGKTLQTDTTLSNKSIGKLFGLSQVTGHRIQKQLRNANLIKTKVRLELIKANCSLLEYNYNYAGGIGGYVYNTANKNLYIRLSNGIECNSI